jgi:hypothetical protein
VFLLVCKSLSWQDSQEESRTGELAVYIDLAENAARDDCSVPARMIKYLQTREE